MALENGVLADVETEHKQRQLLAEYKMADRSSTFLCLL